MHDRSDRLVIGSGFGGSFSVRRLAEKGNRVTVLEKGRRFAPEDFPHRSWDLRRWAAKLGGVPVALATETLRGVPSTADVLGGCPMGATVDEGAIDADHRRFGYEGLNGIDGSAVSAHPGVNPALTITALAERALAKVPASGAASPA